MPSTMPRDIRQPLNAGSSQSVELQANNETPTAEQASTAIHVISSQWKDRAFFVGLLLAMVIPSLTVFTVIASEWISSPSQRGWLILGFGFYIVTALKALWEVFVRVYEQMLYLRVEVQRLSSPTLFEALINLCHRREIGAVRADLQLGPRGTAGTRQAHGEFHSEAAVLELGSTQSCSKSALWVR